MVKKLLTILLFSSLLISSDKYHNKFFISVNKPFDAVLFDVTEDYDRSISAVGFSYLNKKSSSKSKIFHSGFEYLKSVSSYGKVANLVKIDADGNILLDKKAKLNEFNKAVSIIKTPSNGYFVGGYTLSGQLILYKLTSNGSVIFAKTFGTKNYDRMNKLIPLSDGGVLAVGSSTSSRDLFDPMFQTGIGLNDIFLTRFDKYGHIKWSKKYGTKYDDRGIDAKEAFDGSIIVLAETDYDNNRDVTLMRTGENGNKIWLKHFKTEEKITPQKLLRLRDNNFIAVMSKTDIENKEKIYLVKFDLQKNILLQKDIDTTYESVLKDIKEFSNSMLVGVGYVVDSMDTDALVMMFDKDLNLLCQNHFGYTNLDRFYAVKILNNSQTVAVGMTTPDDSQESNMLIAKIKRDCELVSRDIKKIKKETDLLKVLRDIYKKEINEKKLYIDNDLKIVFTDKKLYFKQGIYKLNSYQESFLADFTKKLLPFLKKYKNVIKDLEIQGFTSAEWGKRNRFDKRWKNNMKLSLNRAYEVSKCIYNASDDKKLISDYIKNSGLGFRDLVKIDNKEDRKHSRRVEIRIVLKQKL